MTSLLTVQAIQKVECAEGVGGVGGESVPTEDDSFLKPTESAREFHC